MQASNLSAETVSSTQHVNLVSNHQLDSVARVHEHSHQTMQALFQTSHFTHTYLSLCRLIINKHWVFSVVTSDTDHQ
jgi:hypothetical protein